MQVICSKDELIKGIQTVQNAISSKSTLPVLANILVETKQKALKMASTDLEVGVRCVVKAEVVREGAVTIPAKTFSEFVRTLGEGDEIRILAGEGARLEIQSGKSRCGLLGLPKEDFPVLPEFSEKRAFSMPCKVLREMIKKTLFAVSTDETRYVLNGVFLAIAKGQARMVATDGRRLAYIARPTEETEPEVSAIVPTKAMQEVLRTLTDADDGRVDVSVTENQVAFRRADVVIVSRLIEGHFPNYEQVIPKGLGTHLRVERERVLLMTQRAALGAVDRGGVVRYSLTKGSLKVKGAAQGHVEVEDEMPVDFPGPGMEIAFNPVFVMDALKSCEAKEIILELGGPLSPGVLRPVGDEHFLCVIMPMRA